MISQEELHKILEYEPLTGHFRWKVAKGYKIKVGSIAGSPTGRGYIRIVIDNKKYMSHRLAWLYTFGEWPPKFIDHVNGDKSDNSLTNLRVATRSENGYNTTTPKNNTSGIKGVHWHVGEEKWRGRMNVDGIEVQVGKWDNLEEAALAMEKARKDLHGEFANS